MLSIENERFINAVTFLITNGIVKNKKDFAQKVNIHHQIIYDIYKGRLKPSSELLKISEGLFNINKSYILFGEGEMLKEAEQVKREGVIEITTDQIKEVPKGTPVYDLDATCGKELRDLADENIIGYVNLPEIRTTSHILQATGDSMIPKIYNGDRVVLREVYDKNIIYYGQIYLILTDEYRMLKYIRRSKNDESKVILRSENSEYDDIEIDKADILKMFVVENILSIRNML